MQAVFEPFTVKMPSKPLPGRNELVQQWGKKKEDALVGRVSSLPCKSPGTTWGNYGKGAELDFRLRTRVEVQGLGYSSTITRRYTSSRVEEEKNEQTYPFGQARESRTQIVAKYELFEKERDVLKGEIRNVNEGCMKSFDALDSRR